MPRISAASKSELGEVTLQSSCTVLIFTCSDLGGTAGTVDVGKAVRDVLEKVLLGKAQ